MLGTGTGSVLRSRTQAVQTGPCLEYLPDLGSSLQRISLKRLPFRVGRTCEADFCIPSSQISRLHAEVYYAGNGFRLRDLGSTNGTVLNGQRIQDAPLKHGDIIQLAHLEFRFQTEPQPLPDVAPPNTDYFQSSVPLSILHGRPLLAELLQQRFIQIVFQPIIDLGSGKTIGYEALGRGTHQGLSAKPLDLFRLAERCEMAAELSSVLREVAVEEARRLPGQPALFLNLHPAELSDPALPESLRDLRKGVPTQQRLVVEIHEDTVTDSSSLGRFREDLHRSNMALAFDDFGVGQSRFAELAEAPPDIIKLHITLIRDIHQSRERQSLLRSLIHVARDLDITVLAEGIETDEEADVCAELGCRLGQGFFFGRPKPAPESGEADTWRMDLHSSYESTQLVEVG